MYMGIAVALVIGMVIGYLFCDFIRDGEVDEAWYEGAKAGFDLGSYYERIINGKHERSINGTGNE